MPRKPKRPEFEEFELTDLRHWATRHKMAKDKYVHSKSLKVYAHSLEESAILSLASDLMLGNGPDELQSKFDSLATEATAAFREKNPEFVFQKGGRPKKEEVTT